MKVKMYVTKYNRILNAILMGLVPILLCVITCMVDGKGVWDVYIPSSTWNDELYYYKLVEAILEHGYPMGYFGFNESHALKLSFAAWSPVLLLPWVLWGLVFGWNLMSPILCNMVMMCLAIFFFTYLTKPTKGQMLGMTAMLAMFTPLVRYTFACMPEITCFFLIIVFLGLAISYCEKNTTGKIVGMFILSSLATLMRPYFILFMLLPAFYWFKKHKWAGSIGSLAIVGVTGVVYGAIKHYLGAEYFTDLFNTEWIERFFNEGIISGIKFMLYKIYDVGIQFARMLIESFRTGLPAGALFAAFILILGLMVLTTFGKWRRKEKDVSVYAHFTFCTFGMWIALLLMYKMTEGSKHLSAFIVTGILMVSLVSVKQCWKWIVTTLLCGFLFIVMAKEPINYEIPYRTAELENQLIALNETLEENLELSEKQPSFENTVIWVFSDMVDGQEIQLAWQMLYLFPDEYGINLCYGDYVLENLDNLKSRYIATIPGGEIDKLLKEKETKVMAENEAIVIYKKY